ncbi:TPA: thiol peroxidase [Vibrio vulnificus]|uniref:thiol peroxidase n=1 Tax=Vibrio vulnificus TaxID=672 RepID=UPI0005043B46|nr:thiol peroxidase [Vibrio vulnificus]EHY1015000.1 thiol peroxidase [Vibrio vulnificus]EHY1122655.1 thiol peroxidase [Vibrio vulnificus]EIO3977844.1 thiol peroxidase [Vibrio vulnificus]KFK52275.1 thiol peroxidase [Vibrio vulnificus]KFK52623.1 thiol peroxidase [Vibrio vulnificus]
MTQVTFQGNPVKVVGTIPAVGEKAPEFTLTASDLSDLRLSSFKGQNVIINIFPSIDTPVCAASVRRFNKEASTLENTIVLCISADLPFASGRFCEVEGINNVQHVSTFRNSDFAESYGVSIQEGALRGLTTRAIVCVNADGKVTYSELVKEITDEPTYSLVLNSF